MYTKPSTPLAAQTRKPAHERRAPHKDTKMTHMSLLLETVAERRVVPTPELGALQESLGEMPASLKGEREPLRGLRAPLREMRASSIGVRSTVRAPATGLSSRETVEPGTPLRPRV